MSYTVIEDIAENPLTSQYKNQQSKNTNMWSNTTKQNMRSDFGNNPQYDPQYNRYSETSAMPMEYGGNKDQQNQMIDQVESNNKRTSISKVVSMPQKTVQYQSSTMPSTVSTSLTETTSAPITNEILDEKLKRIALFMEDSVKFFVQKTRKMDEKLVMIDQILKGIGIVLILLLIFMMIKKN